MLWFYKSFFPVVWIAFLNSWQIIWAKAAGTKTTQQIEPVASRIFRVLAFLVAIIILSTTRLPFAWLYRPLWPVGLWAFWIGAVITIGGLLFAVWARVHLGRNWSSSVTIKQGHELITTGPYVLVRHPIYTGILTGFVGTAIALSEVRGAVAFVLIFIAFLTKLRIEEKWMSSHFGQEYVTYARQTAALIPYLF